MHLQVLIQNGELIMGTLCKKTLGASEGSLIHVIWMDKGPEAARAFLSQTQYTVNYWLLQNSCSIGLGDTVADDATRENIKELIDKVSTYCILCILSTMLMVKLHSRLLTSGPACQFARHSGIQAACHQLRRPFFQHSCCYIHRLAIHRKIQLKVRSMSPRLSVCQFLSEI